MSLLIANDLTFAYGAENILKGLSFSVEARDRIGLAGNNGSGKSTLLRVLAGEYELDKGGVSKTRGLTTAFVPQESPPDIDDLTVFDLVANWLPEEEREYLAYRVELALEALGFEESRWQDLFGELSAGWQRLALIARAAVTEPDLLLLDEPTNYLDVGKILKLESWLRDDVMSGVVMVSHDRAMLDACTNRTFFLRDGEVRIFNQPFGRARELLEEQDLAAAKSRAAEEVEIKRLQRSAKRLALWGSQFDNVKFIRRAQSMEKRIDKLKDTQTQTVSDDRRKLELKDAELRPNVLLRVNNLSVDTPDETHLFDVQSLVIAKGDRIALLGPNGAGKSTFLGYLDRASQDPEHKIMRKADIAFNPQCEVGFFDQELSRLPADVGVFRFFSSMFRIGDTMLRSQLVRAGYPASEHDRPIGKLSGGERSRLMFLLLKLENPNFLILDEPTNHLDLAGCEQLEDEILEKELTAVLISHDRRFVDAIATRFVMINRRGLYEIEAAQEFYDTLAAW